jgi:prepilin-type N-terminal cleavage/methylation domain-containing protein
MRSLKRAEARAPGATDSFRMYWRGGVQAAGPSGFSLIEVLVAVGLLAFIITSLTLMFAEVRRVIRRGTNQVEIMEGARATMGMLSQGLQQASLAQREGLVNLRVTLAGQAVLTLPNGSVTTNLLQNVFVLSRAGDQWGMNQFAFDPEQAAAGAATLFLRTSNAWWRTPEFVAVNKPVFEAAWVGANSPYRRVIEGVVHLNVLPYDREGRLINYSDYSTVTTNFLVTGNPPHTYTFFNTNLPASLDLELGILESETLAELRAYAGPELTNRTSVLAFLAQRPDKVHFFRQRIPIHAVNRIVP